MEHGSSVYSQWFQGKLNEIADSLSRDHHLSDSELLNLLHSCVPEQIPNNFRICPLPPDVVSKITTWLLNLPPATQSPTEPLRSKLATGDTGSPSSRAIELDGDPFLSGFSRSEKHRLIAAFGSPSETMPSKTTPVHQQLLHHYLTQSVPPSTLWHRPTGLTTNPAQFTTPMANLHSFYNESLRGYSNRDPSEKPQKAITPRVIRDLNTVDLTPEDVACGQLAGGAFFYAMRSCEYTKVYGDRRTKLLVLSNFRVLSRQ